MIFWKRLNGWSNCVDHFSFLERGHWTNRCQSRLNSSQFLFLLFCLIRFFNYSFGIIHQLKWKLLTWKSVIIPPRHSITNPKSILCDEECILALILVLTNSAGAWDKADFGVLVQRRRRALNILFFDFLLDLFGLLLKYKRIRTKVELMVHKQIASLLLAVKNILRSYNPISNHNEPILLVPLAKIWMYLENVVLSKLIVIALRVCLRYWIVIFNMSMLNRRPTVRRNKFLSFCLGQPIYLFGIIHIIYMAKTVGNNVIPIWDNIILIMSFLNDKFEIVPYFQFDINFENLQAGVIFARNPLLPWVWRGEFSKNKYLTFRSKFFLSFQV